MKRGSTFALVLLFTLVAFVAGASLVYSRLEPERARLAERVWREESFANTSARRTEDVRASWGEQLQGLQSAEPTAPVKYGLYLARIRAVDQASGSFTADWLETVGSGGDHVVNRSRLRQRLHMDPFGAVFVQRPVGPSRPGAWGPKAVDVDDFFKHLSSQSATGAALRKANWWVMVWGTSWLQLVEAPRWRP